MKSAKDKVAALEAMAEDDALRREIEGASREDDDASSRRTASTSCAWASARRS